VYYCLKCLPVAMVSELYRFNSLVVLIRIFPSSRHSHSAAKGCGSLRGSCNIGCRLPTVAQDILCLHVRYRRLVVHAAPCDPANNSKVLYAIRGEKNASRDSTFAAGRSEVWWTSTPADY